MKILFVHQNFPGQYRHLAPALAARGHEVHALTLRTPLPSLPGVRMHAYQVARRPLADQHPLLRDTESKCLRAESAAAVAQRLATAGFQPDLIAVHPGWGEALYLAAVWPRTPQLHFVELFYAAEGQDLGFDPEFGPVDLLARCTTEMKKLTLLHGLHTMRAGVSPTAWQAATVPAPYRDRITVIHDGIDTRLARPDAQARFTARSEAGVELSLTAQDEVLSFVSRSLEPTRGYHRFMRALPRILQARPAAQVVIVGGDDVSYSARPKSGSYKQRFLDEVRPRLDDAALRRIHFVGKLPHPALIRLFQVTRAHVYFTYPFVLSWSLLEAMACGAVVIGSDTAPVREVLRDGANGRLVGFFDEDALVEAVCEALPHRPGSLPLAAAARETVLARYDLASHCLPRQVALAESLAGPLSGSPAAAGGAAPAPD